MSYQERQSIAYLISSLLGVIMYSVYVVQQAQAGSFAQATIPSVWGKAVLVIIAVQIVLSIITSILVNTLPAIKEREAKATLSDERDQLIELKANKLSYVLFGISFLIAMTTLALGQPPLVMFNLIVFALFGAGIIGNIAQLYLYRRGF